MLRVLFSICCAMLLPSGASLHAQDALDVRLSRHVMSAPASLRITVVVQRDRDQRALTIEADSGLFYTSSLIQLDGGSAQRAHSVTYSNLPEGSYVIRVTLSDADEDLAVTERYAEVR
jgi:hypothetical protein